MISGEYGPLDVAISDVNGDGKPDVVVLSSNTAVEVMLQHICPNTWPYIVKYPPTLQATLGQPFSYVVRDGYFSDAETPDNLTLTVSGLPEGLMFTAPATIRSPRHTARFTFHNYGNVY